MFTVLIPTAGAPSFLDNQIRLLRRFCADPINIVVVNDARPFAHPSNWMDAGAAAAISEVCSKRHVVELRTPDRPWWSRRRAPSERTADALNFGFSHIRSHPFVAIIDADMFPVAPFSFRSLLGSADIAGISQIRSALKGALTVRYLWNGFLLLKTQALPDIEMINFGCTRFPRTDTGGKLSFYLRRHPNLNVRNISHLASGCWNDFGLAKALPVWVKEFVSSDPANAAGSFFTEVYADSFFHFRSGGNWQSVLGDKARKYAERYHGFVASLQRG